MNKEFLWNVVNSLLMAGAVMLGALTTGKISLDSFLVAVVAGAAVAVNQFRNYWDSERVKYTGSRKIGAFI